MLLFFSEFDSNSGPKLVHQVPSEINMEEFATFYIPKSYFCNRLLMVEIEHKVFISYPIYIEDVKYDRNIYAFNIGAIIDKRDKQNYNQIRVQHIIRKVALKLKEFEIINQFITSDHQRLKIKYLLDVLKAKMHISDQLNILFDDLNYLSVHLTNPLLRKIPIDHVAEYLVPIPIMPMEDIDVLCPTIKRIVVEINGIESIRRIAFKAESPIELVRVIVQQLYVYNIVDLSDIFQYTNLYCLTPLFLEFMNNKHLKSIGTQFISKLQVSEIEICVYYSQIVPGEIVSDFLDRTVFPSDILDIRRFYMFGIVNKFIHRTREYSILRRDGRLRHYHSASLLSQPDNSGKINDILQLVRLNKDKDELCLLLNMSPNELQKLLQQQFSEDEQYLVTLCK